MTKYPPLPSWVENFVFLGTGTSVREDLTGFLLVRLFFSLLIYCFVDFNESINYTAWAGARLFVSLRGQSGGSLTCFLSVKKKSNYYSISTRSGQTTLFRGSPVDTPRDRYRYYVSHLTLGW